jgi:hypothetical protein
MAILTRAELQAFPDQTFLNELPRQNAPSREGQSGRRSPARASSLAEPVRTSPGTLPRRVDIRRFPGRTRTERVGHYLRAHFPRAQSWSEDSVQLLASELLRSAEIVE